MVVSASLRSILPTCGIVNFQLIARSDLADSGQRNLNSIRQRVHSRSMPRRNRETKLIVVATRQRTFPSDIGQMIAIDRRQRNGVELNTRADTTRLQDMPEIRRQAIRN